MPIPGQWLSAKGNFTHKCPLLHNQHLAMTGDFFCFHNYVIQRVEGRDSGIHPTIHKTRLKTRNYLAQKKIGPSLRNPVAGIVKSLLREATD